MCLSAGDRLNKLQFIQGMEHYVSIKEENKADIGVRSSPTILSFAFQSSGYSWSTEGRISEADDPPEESAEGRSSLMLCHGACGVHLTRLILEALHHLPLSQKER